MGGDEHANASLGFARTPTRHALMETGVNDLNAPSSAAKLASFKGRYVPTPVGPPEPPRRTRRTPRGSRSFPNPAFRVSVRDGSSVSLFFSFIANVFFASRILARRTTNDD